MKGGLSVVDGCAMPLGFLLQFFTYPSVLLRDEISPGVYFCSPPQGFSVPLVEVCNRSNRLQSPPKCQLCPRPLPSCWVATRDRLFLARLSLVDVRLSPRLLLLLSWEGVFVPE